MLKYTDCFFSQLNTCLCYSLLYFNEVLQRMEEPRTFLNEQIGSRNNEIEQEQVCDCGLKLSETVHINLQFPANVCHKRS